MTCCSHCRDAERLFDQRSAARLLRRYRRRGPEGSTRLLIDALRGIGPAGTTLLDIGGGIGVIHHELLRAGAASAVDIDASVASLAAAQSESERLGHGGRVAYRYGDVVALADSVEPADIVTMDRVVCCYPDMPALVGLAARRAQRALGLVFPRDVWWVRAGVRAVNLGLALQRRTFRLFCHPNAAVDAEIRAAGLGLHYQRHYGPWQVALYRRAE